MNFANPYDLLKIKQNFTAFGAIQVVVIYSVTLIAQCE